MFRFLIISTIFIISCCPPAQPIYWSYLQFNKGDILQCRMNSVAYHVLLATSDSDVAHMAGDKTSATGYLWEESWERYHHREGNQQTDCSIRDYSNYDDQAVDNARQDIERYRGQKIYYNLLTCNCEHWVTKWAKGMAYSRQSLLSPSSQCDASNQHRNPIIYLDKEAIEEAGRKIADVSKDVVREGVGFFKSLFGK